MSPGSTYAFVTFVMGILLLLGWAYLTTDNPRSSTLLKRSLLLFVLPILFVPGSWFHFPFSMWVLVAFEEGLKTIAARGERDRLDRFWLVSLFGAWELVLAKPLMAFADSGEFSNWTKLELAGLVFATVLPALMHTITAAIYAFRFEGRLWAAFGTCWIIHTAFNESVDYFGVSVTAACIQTIVLAAILLIAIRPMREVQLPDCASSAPA